VSFGDACRVLESLGFELRRVTGSHHVFSHPDIAKALAEVERAKQAWLTSAREAGQADPRAPLSTRDLLALAPLSTATQDGD
jgi:hypothetical protein